ncbi:MAG: helix-turn-helix transcriptional regulator [Jatrophihabitans sp.]|uniref:helix-turn-helix transcriptional regulator n=1 Tax=Jatrophihabitans sp. TaxID=1932789 RepID=UPI003F80710B
MVIDARTARIVSATEGANAVLGRPAGGVTGRRLDEVLDPTNDPPTPALELLAGGRLTGYEVVHRVRATRATLSFWVRAVPLPAGPDAVAFLLPRPSGRPDASPPSIAAKASGVGALRPDGVVSWVSPEVETLLGRPAAHLVGRRLVDFVPPAEVARLRRTVEAALGARQVASRPVEMSTPGRGDQSLQLLVLPADERAAVFAVIPGVPLERPSTPAAGHPALDRLSGREGDIALALAAGDRVPAIAQKLSLSQGTVRNYLSAIFRKVGVSTQQELIELLRDVG